MRANSLSVFFSEPDYGTVTMHACLHSIAVSCLQCCLASSLDITCSSLLSRKSTGTQNLSASIHLA